MAHQFIDPLHDIKHYSPTMTIAQVLKFCEKKGLGITRAMIQNYIRDGLLPPPVNKRLYTHKHLAVLAVVDKLKTVFDIPTIQQVLMPYMDDEGLPLDVYAALMASANALTQEWISAASDCEPLITMMSLAQMKGIEA